MKILLCSVLLLLLLPSAQPPVIPIEKQVQVKPARNLIIVTLDGVRWQEIFRGADETLLNDLRYTPDTSTMQLLYGGKEQVLRRQRLMPFLWTVLAGSGQLHGNRELDSRMNVANLFRCSYPGYHEMFTGNTDLAISSNKKKHNPHNNVLEYLNRQEGYAGRVAAFTSWDLFPYILGSARNNLVINSGKQKPAQTGPFIFASLNEPQAVSADMAGTRQDLATFAMTKDYLLKYRPAVLFMGLGDMDDFAHAGRYDQYLESLNQADRMIADIWNWVQTTPGYKNNTSLLITTDHGRGSRHNQWTSHGTFIKGSSQTWMAMMGPGVEMKGEVTDGPQLYQQQLASLMAQLVGEKF